ncbi:hypothetical protein MARPO_1745s0001 [Marchantia polymorpha]|uniref:Association with the SNF1 complex (ASC) domain-containing protein n=1 Tax=Marchantia polymorpha TaxID=3197 RepID=A0A2R6VXU0_MARPO|nr:hypothetical protein MARPO_1745s0001 [Marchantia polymorpha]|eukprot:PTQ26427.1 hypothetical protein MARPO_1745s0001 [Marchantia polymorpha]
MKLAIVDQVPESPKSSYTCEYFAEEDFKEEPPVLPPHLSITVFSSGNVDGEPSGIAPPHYSTVNHVYIDTAAHQNPEARKCVCLGITHRFRNKYVSMVLYKPKL